MMNYIVIPQEAIAKSGLLDCTDLLDWYLLQYLFVLSKANLGDFQHEKLPGYRRIHLGAINDQIPLLNCTKTNISNRLKKLSDLKLLHKSKIGNHLYYQLTDTTESILTGANLLTPMETEKPVQMSVSKTTDQNIEQIDQNIERFDQNIERLQVNRGTNIFTIKNTNKSFVEQRVDNILNLTNVILEKNFNMKSEANRKLVRARLAEGYDMKDFVYVLENKNKQWKDTEQEIYLRPSTLFCASHFDSYLNEPPHRKYKKKSSSTTIEVRSPEQHAVKGEIKL
jgi:uncharacterized phage protein (TIGR02220 family)